MLAVGDRVRVKDLFPPGHVRTPFFARGHVGTVGEILGTFKDPEALAYGGGAGAASLTLYRVRFAQRELWPDYAGDPEDTLVADIYATWLEPVR